MTYMGDLQVSLDPVIFCDFEKSLPSRYILYIHSRLESFP